MSRLWVDPVNTIVGPPLPRGRKLTAYPGPTPPFREPVAPYAGEGRLSLDRRSSFDYNVFVMVQNNVINFRCSPEVAKRLDELAGTENRSRSNVLDTLLKRVLDREAIAWPIEQLVSSIRRDEEEHPHATDSKYGDYFRGSLHGAKWMLETILGKYAKDRALNDVRKKLGGPIPHCAPRDKDGSQIGFDSDAW